MQLTFKIDCVYGLLNTSYNTVRLIFIGSLARILKSENNSIRHVPVHLPPLSTYACIHSSSRKTYTRLARCTFTFIRKWLSLACVRFDRRTSVSEKKLYFFMRLRVCKQMGKLYTCLTYIIV